MANLRDQFAPYYAPDEEAVAAALRSGLVTPDTNVMLAAYRFERKARDELLNAFEKLADRLWIPHQVAFEFHRNRLGVIAAQEAFFGATQADLDKAVGAYLEKFKAFANRIAMPQSRVRGVEQMIRRVHAQVKDQVTRAEEANEVHLDRRDSDEVLTRLEALFDGRVGQPMEPDVLAEARKEAKRRVDSKVPPGYADRDKADPYGDYLVWRQLLDEAAVRRVPVVLVTDDRKEDWVRREHGLTLGPRPELCEEMSAVAAVPFLLMSTAAFLRHAKDYLSASVSPETVDQASELPGALRASALAERAKGADIAMLETRFRDLTQEYAAVQGEFARTQQQLGFAERERIRDGAHNEKTLQEIHARLTEAEARKSLLQAMLEETAHSLEVLNRSRDMRRVSPQEEDTGDVQ